jgi:probable phosphoglycerate mutase
MRIVALRHGQSQYNVLGLCNDNDAAAVALTGLGVDQARRAAERLLGDRIDRIFSSPLLRTRQTAEIIAEALCLAVLTEPRLADIRSGCDGRPVAEYLAAIAHDPVDGAVADGESLRDYAHRVKGFLDELRQAETGSVLLVAHEETLRVIESYATGKSLTAVAGKPFANCMPYRFQFDSANR